MLLDVLVVDDDPATRDMLALALSIEGHRVTQARDARAALEAVHRDRPDVVVMDVMMPGMDGLELTRLLRDDLVTAGIPIVMLSAAARTEDVWSGRQAGADSYLTKPVDVLSLLEEILRVAPKNGHTGNRDHSGDQGEVAR